MGAFGCVEIVGPEWCGKTRTASMTKLDDPSERRASLVGSGLLDRARSPFDSQGPLLEATRKGRRRSDAIGRVLDDQTGDAHRAAGMEAAG